MGDTGDPTAQTVTVFEIGGGEAKVQPCTGLIRSGLFYCSVSHRAAAVSLTVSTAAKISMQIKSDVTLKDIKVSLGDSLRCWIFFTNSMEFRI